MLGPVKARNVDRPAIVSLGALVPKQHFYRHLDAVLDLAFVRDWVADLYAERGRPSIDPAVFFKLQLVMFFEGIRSEKQLLALAADRLSVRWYLGYALDERLPDQSTLTRTRQRLGLAFFRRFFEHVVDLCQEAGLVWGKEVLADATRVPGNASMDSLVPRLAEVVDGHLVQLFDDDATQSEVTPVCMDDTPPMLHLKSACTDPAEQDEEKRWDLLRECRLNPDRPASGPISGSPSARSAAPTPTPAPCPCGTGGQSLGTRTTP